MLGVGGPHSRARFASRAELPVLSPGPLRELGTPPPMNLRPFLLLLVSTALAHAAPEPEAKATRIPDPLKPWQAWVLWNDDHRGCPTPFNDAKKHRCFWPSQLAVQVDKAGAQWQLGITVFKDETWVPLPGGAEAWPVEVKSGDAPLPVVEHDGKPAIRLPAGTHQLAGAFRWSELPARLPLPREIGLLALTLDGQPVPAPAWDAEGTLWLRREAAPAAEEASRDFLSTKVHALLEDGIPLWWRTEIELVVSGKSREETLGTILPEGWRLASVESPIPVAIDPATGATKAQVRAGRWTVKLDAFRIDDAKEFRFPPGAKPVAAEQLVAIAAKPDFRLVEIVGAPAIDVSQTPFPDAWRGFPVHRWDTAQSFRFEERLRGPGEGKPAGLTIRREWWLDENGRALTFRDRLSGAMQQTWRLDAAPGQDLGAVWAGGSGAGESITYSPATCRADSNCQSQKMC